MEIDMKTDAAESSRSPHGSTAIDGEIRMTLADLSVAEQALRDEPYARLPALAGMLAIAAMRIEQLKSIVDALPRTADGVPVIPGMDLFRRSKACRECGRCVAIQRPQVDAVESRGIVRRHGHVGGWCENASDLYSTREAAEGR
jgi:hypothetical protein